MSNLNCLFFTLIITALILLPPVALSKSNPEAIEALLNRLDSQRPSPSVQESAAKAVLKRLLPAHVHSFEFKIVPKVQLQPISVGLMVMDFDYSFGCYFLFDCSSFLTGCAFLGVSLFGCLEIFWKEIISFHYN